MLPGMELMSCPDLAVPREVMHHVVRVESSYNPYAIGVVRGRLVRQLRNMAEAVSTARMLEQRGYNFSLGLAQVNRYNLVKYGLNSYEQAFQPCANLVAGSRILRECYGRSGGDWGKSFSCYYSGDFKTGYRHGYVQKIYASMQRGGAGVSNVAPIEVMDRATRRVSAMPAASLPHGSASILDRRSAQQAPQKSAPPVAAARAAAETAPVPAPQSVALPLPTGYPVVHPHQGLAVPTSAMQPVARATAQPSSGATMPMAAVAPGDSAFVF